MKPSDLPATHARDPTTRWVDFPEVTDRIHRYSTLVLLQVVNSLML